MLSACVWSYQAASAQGKKPTAQKPNQKGATAVANKASKAPTAGAKTGAKATIAATAPARQLSSEDVAKKKELLESERFRRARLTFDEWLTVQKAYKKEQIPGLRAAFRKKINAMTPAELEEFLGQMEDKLAVLMSPEAQDARDWLGYFASAKAVLPASEVDQFDIVNMTAGQLEQTLQKVEAKRGARAGASQAFNVSREAGIRRSQVERQQQAARAARSTTSSASSQTRATSPYAPRPPRQPASKDNDLKMWVSPAGGVSFMIP
jgi:hypothetical protein